MTYSSFERGPSLGHFDKHLIDDFSCRGQLDDSAPQSPSATHALCLFPEIIDTSFAVQSLQEPESGSSDTDIDGYDDEPLRLADEICVVLDDDNIPVSSTSRRVCNLIDRVDSGLLHRGFSCFLFDSNDRLLLQQLSSEQTTFCDMWTNTCCSHPFDMSRDAEATLPNATTSVKRAAQAKLEYDFGIQAAQIPLDKFECLTRVHYKTLSDGTWGEHEIDFIVLVKADVNLDVNSHVIQRTKYVSAQELKEMLKDKKVEFTPWFELTCRTMLFEWWEHLDCGPEKYLGDTQIRKI